MRIPLWYDRAMEWLAMHLLPPPKPTGLKLFGYAITQLDLAMLCCGFLIALAALWWYSSIGWFFIALALFAMMWIWMG